MSFAAVSLACCSLYPMWYVGPVSGLLMAFIPFAVILYHKGTVSMGGGTLFGLCSISLKLGIARK